MTTRRGSQSFSSALDSRRMGTASTWGGGPSPSPSILHRPQAGAQPPAIGAHHRHLLEKAWPDRHSLAEIANRRRYDEALESEWRRCIHNNSPLSLIIIDVDRFKTYNDRLGHFALPATILRTIAIALKGFTTTGRLGGTLWRRGIRPASAAGGCAGGQPYRRRHPRNRGTDAAGAPGVAGQPYVTISLGGMTTQPYDGQVDPQFFRDADAALYAAKAREETASSGRRRRVEACSGRLVLLGKSVRLQVFPNAGTLMADIGTRSRVWQFPAGHSPSHSSETTTSFISPSTWRSPSQ